MVDVRMIAPGGRAPGSRRVPWAGTDRTIAAASGGGTIAFDNANATVTTSGSLSANVDISTAAVGAWCYAWIALGTASGTVSAAGWNDVNIVVNADDGAVAHYALLRRKKQLGDTTFSFSWSVSAKGVLSWASWTGLDDVTPDEGAVFTVNAVTSRTAVPSGSSTPTAATRWAVVFSSARTSTAGNKPITWTADAALVERLDIDNNAAGSAAWMGVEIADSNSAVTQASHSYTATHAPAAESHDATVILFLVPGAAGSATNANAESPTGAGVASDAAVDIQVNAEQPTATGSAADAAAALGANAEQPGGTGSAFDTSVANTASAEAPAGVGTAPDGSPAITTSAEQSGGTGSAADATGSLGVTPAAASGTGAAQDGSVAITVNAEQPAGVGGAQDATGALATSAGNATGAGVASDGTGSVATQPGTPSGTGTSGDGSSAITVNAEAPGGTGTAFDATVTTSGQTNAPAEVANGTGTAQDASISVASNPATAIGTGAAQDAQGALGALAQAPAGAGSAADASSALTTAAPTATGAGVAADGTGALATQPATAQGAGTAYDATVATYAVGVALGAGQAFDATVEIVSADVAVVHPDARMIPGNAAGVMVVGSAGRADGPPVVQPLRMMPGQTASGSPAAMVVGSAGKPGGAPLVMPRAVIGEPDVELPVVTGRAVR